MENKELMAIDANEKLRIDQLNQSTILPNSVTITVKTLVEKKDDVAEITEEEILPEIVTNEELESAEEEEEDEGLQIIGVPEEDLPVIGAPKEKED